MLRVRIGGKCAVLYIRVSTEKQADGGISLDAQEERLRAYCTMRGLEVAEVIIDPAQSAFKKLTARPGGKRLVQLVRSGKVGAVVALKLDRPFRNTVDCLSMLNAWERDGVGVHLVDLGGSAVDTSSATGKMFLTMLAGFAEFERNLTSERTRLALAHKARSGELRLGRDAPYGYGHDGDGLVPMDAEQAVISTARTLREQGQSLEQIASELSRQGHRNRAGKVFARQSVHTMLRGPARLAHG
jgi:DNA invertase Pin-like site-specific DNA recombinase